MDATARTVPTDPHIEAPVLELPVLLAERAPLAAPVHEEVRALPFVEIVVRPHLGPVHAGVEAPHPREGADRRVGCSAPDTRWANRITEDHAMAP
jgi:hypothetical protein